MMKTRIGSGWIRIGARVKTILSWSNIHWASRDQVTEVCLWRTAVNGAILLKNKASIKISKPPEVLQLLDVLGSCPSLNKIYLSGVHLEALWDKMKPNNAMECWFKLHFPNFAYRWCWQSHTRTDCMCWICCSGLSEKIQYLGCHEVAHSQCAGMLPRCSLDWLALPNTCSHANFERPFSLAFPTISSHHPLHDLHQV